MIGGTPISGNLHRTGGQTINQLLSVDYQHFDPETIHIYIYVTGYQSTTMVNIQSSAIVSIFWRQNIWTRNDMKL